MTPIQPMTLQRYSRTWSNCKLLKNFAKHIEFAILINNTSFSRNTSADMRKKSRGDAETLEKKGYANQQPAPFPETVATEVFEPFMEQILEDMDGAFERKNFRLLGAALRKLADFRSQGDVEKKGQTWTSDNQGIF